MENQFKHALNGIRTLMSTVIQSIRERGLQADETTVAEFGIKLRTEINAFKRAVILLRREISDTGTIEKLMHYKLDELLEIMDLPHPEHFKAGHHVSPHKPGDPVYFAVYFDLLELGKWIRESCSRDNSKSPVLSQASEAMARYEFVGLADVEQDFRKRGVNKDLLEALMQPFSRFKSTRSTDLMHYEFINLLELKDAILQNQTRTDDKIHNALHVLLYALNVNTDKSIEYCKERLEEKLDNARSDNERREVLSREEKLIGQATIKANIKFDPFNDNLTAYILKFIKEEDKFLTKHPEASTSAEPVPYTLPEVWTYVKLGVSNEQHAALMRAMQAVGYFVGLDKYIIAVTGRLLLSSKGKDIGMPAYRTNFYTPTPGGANGAFHFIMQLAVWMSDMWREFDIPDFDAMDPHVLKKFILSFRIPPTDSK